MPIDFKPKPAKKTGRPRVKPFNSVRPNVNWITKEHAKLLRRIGRGNLSRGLRMILDERLLSEKQSVISNP